MKADFKKLNSHIRKLLDEVDIADVEGNLEIGYLLIWIKTLEQDAKEVISLCKFQERLIERHQATDTQAFTAFQTASTTFEELTGIPVPTNLDTIKDWWPMIPNLRPSISEIESTLYLN
jgi:hypothetical protein